MERSDIPTGRYLSHTTIHAPGTSRRLAPACAVPATDPHQRASGLRAASAGSCCRAIRSGAAWPCREQSVAVLAARPGPLGDGWQRQRSSGILSSFAAATEGKKLRRRRAVSAAVAAARRRVPLSLAFLASASCGACPGRAAPRAAMLRAAPAGCRGAYRTDQERTFPTVTGQTSLTSTVNRYTLRARSSCLLGSKNVSFTSQQSESGRQIGLRSTSMVSSSISPLSADSKTLSTFKAFVAA